MGARSTASADTCLSRHDAATRHQELFKLRLPSARRDLSAAIRIFAPRFARASKFLRDAARDLRNSTPSRSFSYGQDRLAEWPKALAAGASPQGRGLERHPCQLSPPSSPNRTANYRAGLPAGYWQNARFRISMALVKQHPYSEELIARSLSLRQYVFSTKNDEADE